MPRYVQPGLFGHLAFVARKRKIVKTGKEKFRTGRVKGVQAPLGITRLGQRAARSKVARLKGKI